MPEDEAHRAGDKETELEFASAVALIRVEIRCFPRAFGRSSVEGRMIGDVWMRATCRHQRSEVGRQRGVTPFDIATAVKEANCPQQHGGTKRRLRPRELRGFCELERESDCRCRGC